MLPQFPGLSKVGPGTQSPQSASLLPEAPQQYQACPVATSTSVAGAQPSPLNTRP